MIKLNNQKFTNESKTRTVEDRIARLESMGEWLSTRISDLHHDLEKRLGEFKEKVTSLEEEVCREGILRRKADLKIAVLEKKIDEINSFSQGTEARFIALERKSAVWDPEDIEYRIRDLEKKTLANAKEG